jgi:hypothetical protein
MGVPKALRPIVGKWELLEALGADLTTANRQHSAAIARMQALLDEARRQTSQEKLRPTPRRGKPLTIREMALAHYNSQIAFDDELRNSDSRFASMGFPDEQYIADLKRIQRGGAPDDEVQKTLGRIMVKFSHQGHTSAGAGTPEWRELARALATAELESIYRMIERDDNDFTGTPQHPILVAGPEPSPPTPTGASSRVIGPES